MTNIIGPKVIRTANIAIPRHYSTSGNTTPPLPVEQDAAYWRERYEI